MSALALAAVAGADEVLAGGFTAIDWAIVAGFLALVTWVGHRLTGKQTGLRDFYLGGRRLPWYAVSASIIATEISAVTYFVVPSMVARDGGTLLYLQVGLISALVARTFIALVLVPAYYDREIYSPYDFMGDRLGSGVRKMTTVLFMIAGTLGQAARVYVTAVVIDVLSREQLQVVSNLTGLPTLAVAIALIAAVALLWTWIGGVATVVWTDALLFILFIVGLCAMLVVLQGDIDGGLGAAWTAASDAGRLQLFDPSWSMLEPYTLFSVVVGASIGFIAPYGTDQLIAQRLLTCRTKRDAQLAMLASNLSVIVVGLAFAVGIGLIGYYGQSEMSPGAAAMVADKPERILPVFVREVLPVGVRGLVLAAAFAAAISSLDSILAALGQATSSLRSSWAQQRAVAGEDAGDGSESLRFTRFAVLGWAVLLASVAWLMQFVEAQYKSLLDLSLAMSAFVGGPILAAFLIARFAPPGRGAAGFLWAAPLGALAVLFTKWHGDDAYAASWWLVGAVFLLWLLFGLPRRRHPYAAIQTIWYAFSLFLLTRVAEVGDFEPSSAGGAQRAIAWPWYVPIGAAITGLYAFLLDRPARRGGRPDGS